MVTSNTSEAMSLCTSFNSLLSLIFLRLPYRAFVMTNPLFSSCLFFLRLETGSSNFLAFSAAFLASVSYTGKMISSITCQFLKKKRHLNMEKQLGNYCKPTYCKKEKITIWLKSERHDMYICIPFRLVCGYQIWIIVQKQNYTLIGSLV